MSEEGLPLTSTTPTRRGMAVRLDPEDAETVREIARATDSSQTEVLEILQAGCRQAIRSGNLKRSIVHRKMQALQMLIQDVQPEAMALPPRPPQMPTAEEADGPPPRMPVVTMQVPSLTPQLAAEAPAAPMLDPAQARRTYS